MNTKMSARTLRALKGSIVKWKKIVAGTGFDESVNNCPLCALFYDEGCSGCPVRERTGRRYCDKTPYQAWALHHDKNSSHSCGRLVVDCPKCKELAKKEVLFLQGLLPDKAVR